MTLPTLLALFAARGAARVEPPVIQPADIFLDTAGEDIRRRLFLTEDHDGRALCLRPDYTIPVCRHHIESGTPSPAIYAYGGPVFRKRPGELGEFGQAGVEMIGHEDRAEADAAALALALDAVAAVGRPAPEIRIGDEGLFTAVMEALGLAPAARRRLRSAFGDRARLDATLDRLVAGDGAGGIAAHAGVMTALAGADRAGARALVEDLLSIAGVGSGPSAVGRSAGEIAERFLDQASTGGSQLAPGTAALVRRFLDIAGPAEAAADRLEAFFGELTLEHGLEAGAFGRSIAEFRRRVDLVERAGVAPARLAFSAGFGRNLDYYTGFIFELTRADGTPGKPMVGGGRYDGLMALLGAPGAVPAVGFSIWLERLGERA